jgi:hypothetical protein
MAQLVGLYHTSDDRWLVLAQGRTIFGSFPDRFAATKFLNSSPEVKAYIEGRNQESERIASICAHSVVRQFPELLSDLVNGGKDFEECDRILNSITTAPRGIQ